jgi:hypothetical protein
MVELNGVTVGKEYNHFASLAATQATLKDTCQHSTTQQECRGCTWLQDMPLSHIVRLAAALCFSTKNHKQGPKMWPSTMKVRQTLC